MSNADRYERQIALTEIGPAGQKALQEKCVLIVGAGGLGSPLLYYLAAMGIGEIRIVDHDIVGPSNLQRQILFNEGDLGKEKALIAKKRIELLNHQCKVKAFVERFDYSSAERLALGCDLLIDACDNFSTRYILDATSRRLSIPYLYGAVARFEGQISLFNYQGGPSYSDLYPTFSEEKEKEIVPILGSVAGIFGSILATEAIKALLDIGSPLSGKILIIDTLTWTTNILKLQ